jgi:hypothetical protein
VKEGAREPPNEGMQLTRPGLSTIEPSFLLIPGVVRTPGGASVVSRILIVGALAALAVQILLLFGDTILFPWFYIAPLLTVVLFLSVLAWAALPLALPANMGFAAAMAVAGYVIRVSPSQLLSPSAELTICMMGAGSLVVLACRVGRSIQLEAVREGWLVCSAGIGGAVILGQAGAKRCTLLVTREPAAAADSVRWAWYISLVLAFAASLAVSGRLRLRPRASREIPSRTTRA